MLELYTHFVGILSKMFKSFWFRESDILVSKCLLFLCCCCFVFAKFNGKDVGQGSLKNCKGTLFVFASVNISSIIMQYLFISYFYVQNIYRPPEKHICLTENARILELRSFSCKWFPILCNTVFKAKLRSI